MSFYKIAIIIFLSASLYSCNNTKEVKGKAVTSVIKNNTSFGNKDFSFPALSETAKNEVLRWGAFTDFENEIKNINGNKIEELTLKTKILVSHIDSLTRKIPDTLNTRAIFARLMVVKTRANLLQQEVLKDRIDSLRLQNYFNEMNIAATNFINQINEKFQKDAIDLQRIDNEKQELEKQKRFLDSVRKVELQDLNKN